MFRFFALFSMLGLLLTSSSAHNSVRTGTSAKQIIERFCKMDKEGKLLSAAGSNETANLFVSPVGWQPNRSVVVISDYLVRGNGMDGKSARFTVVYRVWGEIDSLFRFTREEGDAVNKPVEAREYYQLALTGRHNKLGDKGSMVVVEGPVQWRIGITPSRPHIGVDTAIGFLTQQRDLSSDGDAKKNADKTIAALRRLEIHVAQAPATQTLKSPTRVVREFCEMDAKGMQLESVGWSKMSRLLVQPGSPHQGRVTIVRDFVVSNASIHDENKAEVAVEYIYLGGLDTGTGLLDPAPLSDRKVRIDFPLALTHNSAPSDPGSTVGGEPKNGAIWKIEAPPRESFLTVDSAIRYTTEILNKTSNPAVKKNADETLSKLAHLK